MSKLTIHFSITNNILVVAMSGQILEESTLKNLFAEIEEKMVYVKGKIILDLASLQYINSSGINFFIKIHKKTLENNKKLVIARANTSVTHVLTIAKMNQIFELTPTLDEAFSRVHTNASIHTTSEQ